MTTTTAKNSRALAMLAATVLVAGLLGPTKPAEAAFPGNNGKIVFASDRTTVLNQGGDNELFKMNPDGIGAEQLTFNASEESTPVFSADGEKIAFVSDQFGNDDVYVMDSDSNVASPTRLTFSSAADNQPAFSPDGEQVLFTSYRDGNAEIYAVNSDATGTPTNLTNDPAPDRNPAYSPDGTKIAFESQRKAGKGVENQTGDEEIFKMNPDGTGLKQLTKNEIYDSDPAWSPGAQKIAFVRAPAGNDNEVYTMKADGTGQKNRTKNAATDRAPAFSPDGKKIAFASDRGSTTIEDVYTMNSDGTAQIDRTNNNTDDLDPDWQPS